MKQVTPPEWSHNVEAEDIGDHPVRKQISASPQQRKDLARRLGIEAVNSLKADLVLSQQAGKSVINVSGQFEANVTQTCVVSGDAFDSVMNGDVEGWFANPAHIVSLDKARNIKKSKKGESEVPMIDEKDDPEPIVDGLIDIGELVTQHLSLQLDPFPHKEGEHFETGDESFVQRPNEERQNPFAGLKALKEKKEKEKAE
ncbi:MAG TPA: DUF177 domain-containing protein [Micavibrio sp.]|nr:YceD family protein [Pseudomonadota bacterium]MEC8664865.1 YceD family protein [Pseudomonadota bacterium]HIF26864.1 DUF177 domain-containing protein [Micavibrio sp.]HIL29723.1 DUF177 domain-containing protein [Micavibrio sp.]